MTVCGAFTGSGQRWEKEVLGSFGLCIQAVQGAGHPQRLQGNRADAHQRCVCVCVCTIETPLFVVTCGTDLASC